MLMDILKRLAPELKNSITFDKPRQEASGSTPERTEASRPRRGSEFARHGLLAPPLAICRQRHDDLVLRRLRQLAERQRREHQWPAATTAAEPSRPRHRAPSQPPGDRPLAPSHTAQMPRLSDPDPGLLQRTWQRYRATSCQKELPLHLAGESTARPICCGAGFIMPSTSRVMRRTRCGPCSGRVTAWWRSAGPKNLSGQNTIRGLLETFGLVLGKGAGGRFAVLIEESLESRPSLRPAIEPLLAIWQATRKAADAMH